jgi:hypothetical protein
MIGTALIRLVVRRLVTSATDVSAAAVTTCSVMTSRTRHCCIAETFLSASSAGSMPTATTKGIDVVFPASRHWRGAARVGCGQHRPV